jgi:hypothetical protein
MNKYSKLQSNIFSVFSSEAWKAEGLKTFPDNLAIIDPGSEFIRVSILPGNVGININSVSGVLIVDIFTSAGSGPNKTTTIADKLDRYLVGKTLSVNTSSVQFSNSTMQPRGLDRDNPSLHRSIYTIPFNYFEV